MQKIEQKIKNIIENLHPKPYEVSFAIVNLKSNNTEVLGYNINKFIYPASVYKVFVGAEMLRQIYDKKYSLDQIIEIKGMDDFDKNYNLFPKFTSADNRPPLMKGNRVTIDYLLDLMFSRSDNVASNILTNLITKESLNNFIISNNWKGSEIPEKFLVQKKEIEKYRHSDITVTCAKHLVELFYKIEKNQLVNEWVSIKLKDYMRKWNRNGRSGLNLPEFKDYYRKGGQLEINHYKINFLGAIRNIFKKGYAIKRWSNDAGVVTTDDCHYVIAILTSTKTLLPWAKFPMKRFSREVLALIK